MGFTGGLRAIEFPAGVCVCNDLSVTLTLGIWWGNFWNFPLNCSRLAQTKIHF